jgi:hypothetical protein
MKVSIELSREEVDEALREYAAEKLGLGGDVSGNVKFTISAKRDVTGARVAVEQAS